MRPTAAVTITIALGASKNAFEFRNRLGTTVSGGVGARLAEAVEKRDELRRNLESVLKVAGKGLELGWPQADAVFRRFSMLGSGLLLHIFKSDDDTALDNAVSKLCAIEALFKEVLPPSPAAGTWPIVEIVAPLTDGLATSFPFELLPFLNTGELPRIDSYAGLHEAMRAFLGFSAIVARKRFDEPPNLRFTATDGSRPAQLPLKFFYHADLEGAVDESNFLKRRTDLHVEGPWPEDLVEDGERAVADHIINPGKLLNGQTRALVDQIQHFSCHCDTQDKSAFFSLLAKGKETGIDVKLDDLPVYRAYELRHGFHGHDMPLVVFNNCGGGAINESQLNSFVEFFWATNRNRGFISTQARIPDKLAEAFSKQFYINLLRNRLLVGEAVAEARRAITLAYKNPVSLFYVHYGSPFLGLESP